MYPASIIAYTFVQMGIKEGNPLTQMKLQKILYFAHGIHLAQDFGPLINEAFQAWKFGPVVPTIYNDYKLYGSALIIDTSMLSIMRNIDELTTTIIDERAKEDINITWNTLKDIDAIRLSAWTHEEDSPWDIQWKKNLSNSEIPNDEIEKYFKEKFIKK